jgi:hypothetical protein
MSVSRGEVAAGAARIGPNAITRLALALPRHMGLRATRALFRSVGLEQRGCDYYAATLQTLFCHLVHPATRVIEAECEAAGGKECRFDFRWGAGA